MKAFAEYEASSQLRKSILRQTRDPDKCTILPGMRVAFYRTNPRRAGSDVRARPRKRVASSSAPAVAAKRTRRATTTLSSTPATGTSALPRA